MTRIPLEVDAPEAIVVQPSAEVVPLPAEERRIVLRAEAPTIVPLPVELRQVQPIRVDTTSQVVPVPVDDRDIALYRVDSRTGCRCEDADMTITYPAGEQIFVNRAVHVVGGQVFLVDPSDISQVNRAVGLSRTAAAPGEPVTILTGGPVSEVAWSWTSDLVYIGPDGVLREILPVTGVMQRIARVMTPTTLYIDLDEPVVLG